MNSKVIIVVLMLLTFVGQVTSASALPCDMDMQENGSMMDHSSHGMNVGKTIKDIDSKDDCCTSSGFCSMSGCISLALPADLEETKVSFTTDILDTPSNLALSQITASLYRPPILV